FEGNCSKSRIPLFAAVLNLSMFRGRAPRELAALIGFWGHRRRDLIQTTCVCECQHQGGMKRHAVGISEKDANFAASSAARSTLRFSSSARAARSSARAAASSLLNAAHSASMPALRSANSAVRFILALAQPEATLPGS